MQIAIEPIYVVLLYSRTNKYKLRNEYQKPFAGTMQIFSFILMATWSVIDSTLLTPTILSKWDNISFVGIDLSWLHAFAKLILNYAFVKLNSKYCFYWKTLAVFQTNHNSKWSSKFTKFAVKNCIHGDSPGVAVNRICLVLMRIYGKLMPRTNLYWKVLCMICSRDRAPNKIFIKKLKCFIVEILLLTVSWFWKWLNETDDKTRKAPESSFSSHLLEFTKIIHATVPHHS